MCLSFLGTNFCFPDNAFMLYYKGSPDFAASIRNYKLILLV